MVAPSPKTGTAAAMSRAVIRLAVALRAPARGTGAVVHALRVLGSPTSLDPGCLGCHVWIEDEDQSLVRYEEAWVTEDGMRARIRSHAFTRFLEVLESAPEAPVIRFDFIGDRRGLDYVEEIRGADGPDPLGYWAPR